MQEIELGAWLTSHYVIEHRSTNYVIEHRSTKQYSMRITNPAWSIYASLKNKKAQLQITSIYELKWNM